MKTFPPTITDSFNHDSAVDRNFLCSGGEIHVDDGEVLVKVVVIDVF